MPTHLIVPAQHGEKESGGMPGHSAYAEARVLLGRKRTKQIAGQAEDVDLVLQ